MSIEQIAEGLQSEKLAAKLVEEIEKSKSASLDLLLPAFSIPLIGKTAAEKLCKVINHISELTSEVCEKAGIGPKATENLLNWFEEEFVGISSLPFTFSTAGIESKPTKGIVCITGKLKSFKTKAEAEKFLLDLGYIVKSSITKEVTILVNESGVESAKTQKARDNGVSIITNLSDLTGE
jgi:NAD-dependent DNA ligase